MSEPNTPSMLILPCKDCHQPVSDSETNAYRLIAGILYGWCNECFNKQQRFLKFGQQPAQAVAAVAMSGAKG
jgi:hypothetical protein